MYKRALAGIGYLPQEASIFRKLTVEENLLAILEDVEPDGKKRQEKMEALIEEFHIGHIRKSLGTALSGGERRRVEIARALATEPAFIFLMNLLQALTHCRGRYPGPCQTSAKRGIGVLITDHNVRETLSIVDKAYILNEGKIMVEGPSEKSLPTRLPGSTTLEKTLRCEAYHEDT